MTNELPKLLRDAERRVNAHIWRDAPENQGKDNIIASIPARPDYDVDLLLTRAADEIECLRDALRGLSNMYSRTWDRVDGALMMMPDNIERFEKAHAAAQSALGEPVDGDAHEPLEPPTPVADGFELSYRIQITSDTPQKVEVARREILDFVLDVPDRIDVMVIVDRNKTDAKPANLASRDAKSEASGCCYCDQGMPFMDMAPSYKVTGVRYHQGVNVIFVCSSKRT